MTVPRVLLVDDEEDFLHLLAKRLRRRQLDVACATTAEAALAMITREPFDVAVLDVRLPGMDGLEALDRIRRARHAPQIIMLTGYADLEMARQATQHGACAFLVKPVEVEKLRDRIEEALAGRCSPPDSEEP